MGARIRYWIHLATPDWLWYRLPKRLKWWAVFGNWRGE